MSTVRLLHFNVVAVLFSARVGALPALSGHFGIGTSDFSLAELHRDVFWAISRKSSEKRTKLGHCSVAALEKKVQQTNCTVITKALKSIYVQ